jgi:hypothetical protein
VLYVSLEDFLVRGALKAAIVSPIPPRVIEAKSVVLLPRLRGTCRCTCSPFRE